ncbi:MAG: 2-oxoacid:acceptor oxidoreductase subunit alpha [Planctomycetota bacterium]|jgi:2-oxoglutarate ferredoxin oxidoreductase subunit alpha
MTQDLESPPESTKPIESVAIRFCGDSGDGMQLTGGQFSDTSAVFGNDIATFPDFPAEIRAPRGTTYGVSAFQVHFAATDIFTPGDQINALVAMNPAGFKTNIEDVEAGGIIIVNEDEFTPGNLKKAGYEDGVNPLDDEDLYLHYRVFKIPMSRMTRESLAESGMGAKDIDRCRNMYALGIVYWLYDRPIEPTVAFLEEQFTKRKGKPEIAEINISALKAGYYLGETAELFPVRYSVAPADFKPGTYRKISGNEATALGCFIAAHKANKPLTYASYPITPASDILHQLSSLKRFGVKTFQAEDEIAAVCAAIGAAYAGDLALTGSSGPGIALKGEALSLAVMLELPMVCVDVQRAGPATGMPTKTEQADLMLALWGRPSESPAVVIAPQSPSDCFAAAIEAFRMAVRGMCPVLFLTDGYIANGAEPWLLPNLDDIPPIEVEHPTSNNNPDGAFLPYLRDPDTLARPWAIPGVEGLEHRLGGLEKQDGTGNVSYDPDNHDHMVRTRAAKIQKLVDLVPPLEVLGPEKGDLLLLGWGGTYGAITTAGKHLREMGHSVATAHLRYLNPMPANLDQVLGNYKTVVIPEINMGQLRSVIRSRFLIDALGINEMRGKMFQVDTLVQRTLEIIER